MGSGGVEVEERWCKGWTKRGRDGWGKIGVGCVEKKGRSLKREKSPNMIQADKRNI